jgi:hypothetical protein
MTDKLIVSNKGALRRKYGAAGLARIGTALKQLIAADRKRGLATSVRFLDDARSMRGRRASAVTDPADYAATKAAIDALFRTERPDYLMLLGAPDIVAHQPLLNPLYDPPGEPDRYAWSDLPYACAGHFSNDIASFTGPTRVVGRLPDLTGATEPGQAAHLVGLLKSAAGYRSRDTEDYAAHFALSAHSWAVSSARNLFEIFGNRDHLRTAPPSGPRFGASALAPLAHFINCHGDEGSAEFQGQFGRNYPVALSTRAVTGHITPGTVAGVECCYGAELYAADLIGIDIPICQSYLEQGAHGYFGSTTIAYGESRTLAAADLIVQYFLLEVMAGASIGRAALRARQRYVREIVDLDPTDLKTLAQFTLLGDPAVHPVRTAAPAIGGNAADSEVGDRQRRRERRAKLASEGAHLQASRATASRATKLPALSAGVHNALKTIAKEAGIRSTERFRMFAVRPPVAPVAEQPGRAVRKAAAAGGAARIDTRGRRFFVAIEKPSNAGGGPHAVAVVVKEVAGRIVDVRKYEQR